MNNIKPNMREVALSAISHAVDGAVVYRHNDETWLILPDRKEWVVSVYDSGYMFYNFYFFKNLFRYLSLLVPADKRYIKSWVKKNLKVSVGQHVHPDFLPNDYDWSNQFDVNEVIEKGIPLKKYEKL